MRRPVLLAAVLLVTGCQAHRFGVGVPVVRATSPHFAAIGDVPQERLELELRRLEQLYDVFAVFFRSEPKAGQVVRVAVMREGEPAEFIEGAGGFVTHDALEPVVITSVGEDDRWFVTNTHELVHLLSRFALPVQPRWFAEGIASLFEDAHFQRDGSVKMGTWRDVTSWVSLDELLAWDERPVSVADSGPFYETARAVLFYLANRDEARLTQLLDGMRARRPTAELYADLFPPDERLALLEKVKAFVAERKYSAWKTELLRTAEVRPGAPVEPWEVALWRSLLFRVTGNQRAAHEALLEARARARPPLPPALVAELVEREQPVVVDDTPEPLVRLARAASLVRSYSEQLDDARAAVAGLPHSALAALRLAVAARAARRYDEALSSARRAAELAPWATQAVFEQSRALAGLHRCAEAREAFTAAIGMLEAPEPSWVTRQQRDIVDACRESP
jgi:hypothetical protein